MRSYHGLAHNVVLAAHGERAGQLTVEQIQRRQKRA